MTAVLVTGAAGFVGRAACAEFAKRGWTVRAGVRTANTDLAKGWPLDGVDVVLHLAGIAHELHGQNAEAAYQEMNCAATERLARAAAQAGVRRFVFMSSIKVNGERTPLDRPFRAGDVPQPQDRYARSKWNAERALARLGSKLEIVILRPPLVYGPGVRANFLRLVRLVERRLPLPFGAIRNRRSLIYVGNLVELIVLAAASPAAAGRTLLASDGEDLSTPQLAREIGDALGAPARLIPVPVSLLKLAGTMTGMRAEIGRLVDSLALDASETREQLGWRPAWSPSEGIAETVRWYRSAAAAR
ncbi:MAG TPA: NAD-dependent epimerase/dehydratase family protein [Burkholderiales bacterium]